MKHEIYQDTDCPQTEGQCPYHTLGFVYKVMIVPSLLSLTAITVSESNRRSGTSGSLLIYCLSTEKHEIYQDTDCPQTEGPPPCNCSVCEETATKDAFQEYANAKFAQEVEDSVDIDRAYGRLEDLFGLFAKLITSDADTIVVRRDDEACDYVVEATFRV